MKQRIVIAVVATILLGSAPLLTSVGAQATIAPIAAACSPTTSTIGGKSAVTYCGPATATLVTGGKTYKFTKGECVSIKVSDITVDLTLGTLVQGKNDTVLKGNANKPYLSLDLSTPNSDILGAADFGGKQISTGAGIVVTGKVVRSGSSKGTFQSEPGSAAGDAFTGSWNCHGAFAKE
jgi:hypothetical protein